MEQSVKLHNKFRLVFEDMETGEVQEAFAENIVLETYFSRMLSGQDPTKNISVGTGTGTLSTSRTTLFSFLATNTESVSDNAIVFSGLTAYRQRKVRFLETEAVGTWTEIGFCYTDNSVLYMTTHAMLKDSEGNQITITKNNTTVVTVYATIYSEVTAPVLPHCFGSASPLS